MKKYISLFLLIIFTLSGLLAVGCTQAPEPKPPQATQNGAKPKPDTTQKPPTQKPTIPATVLAPKDFFPLAKGLSWEYEGEGNEYASFKREVLFSKDESLGQIREDNGGTVSASVFKITTEAVTRIYFLGEAYGETNYLDSKPNENIIILKAPLKVGTKWSEPNGTREIIDVKATVNTPAENFTDCIKIKITNKDSIVYEYFKKDVGMVKREFTSGETTVTSTLKKFNKPQ